MPPCNLSEFKFTEKPDRVNSDNGIFNPVDSDIKTLEDADEIIGNDYVNSDLVFGVLIDVAAENLNDIASENLSVEADVNVNGIDNQESISTNRGHDIVNGTAIAKIAVVAQTLSQVIAYTEDLDTNAIAKTFANIDINVIANGINNSGELITGTGNDSIYGEVIGSVAAVATADATAIVEYIAEAPVDEITVFAGAIAQSLANATITATGIKNVGGRIDTESGADNINAIAFSDSATYAKTFTDSYSSGTHHNLALAEAVAEAIATARNKAIAIDNTRGSIQTGKGRDTITAIAYATDKAIAIENTSGIIETGKGADNIEAYATGLDSYGIFGGTIDMGRGRDRVEASSFGGGVNINMGEGRDFVAGFGDAIVNGGSDFDILSFDSYTIDDFNISLGATNNNEVNFERDGISMSVMNFEQFNFANASLTLSYDDLLA